MKFIRTVELTKIVFIKETIGGQNVLNYLRFIIFKNV